jgi:hypothetical protein
LLLPSVLQILGPRAWWMPGWLNRRAPRISIEPIASDESAANSMTAEWCTSPLHMHLVDSSDPDAVGRDRAIWLLSERAVLTRAVCRELREGDAGYATRRTRAAISILLMWIQTNLPESVRVSPDAHDGIDDMVQPPGSEAIVAEIRDRAAVCRAFFMLLTADTSFQAEGDGARLRARLDDYWSEHPGVAPTPEL